MVVWESLEESFVERQNLQRTCYVHSVKDCVDQFGGLYRLSNKTITHNIRPWGLIRHVPLSSWVQLSWAGDGTDTNIFATLD